MFLSHTREFREYPAPPGRSFVAAAERAVTRAGDVVSDMEYFAARDEKPSSYCRQQVRACDVYVGLIGFRLGSSVRDSPDLSYTELEYEEASAKGMVRLIFLLGDDAEVPPKVVLDVGERYERQQAFRRRLAEDGITVMTFRNTAELELKLYQALRESPRHAPPAGEPPTQARPASQISYSRLVFDEELDAEDGQELFSVAFSPDDGLVAAGGDEQVLIWDRRRGTDPVSIIRGHKSYVYSVAFGDQGRVIASGGQDGVVRVADVATGQLRWEQHHGAAVYSVAFSADGRRLASGGYDRSVMLWDARTGEFQRSPRPHGGRITSVAFDPQSRYLAIGSLDDTVAVWDVRTGETRVLRGHTSSVESVVFAPKGNRLLLASGGLDKKVIVWDVASGEIKWSGREHEYLVRSVAFSPDGGTLASASWDETVRLWETGTGECTRTLPWDPKNLPWHSDWIWSVAFSPNGMTLASGGSDGRILLWKVMPDDTGP